MGQLDKIVGVVGKDAKKREEKPEDIWNELDQDMLREAKRKIQNSKLDEINLHALEKQMEFERKKEEFEEWKRGRRTRRKDIAEVSAEDIGSRHDMEDEDPKELQEWAEKLAKYEDPQREAIVATYRSLKRRGGQDSMMPFLLRLGEGAKQVPQQDFKSIMEGFGSLIENIQKLTPKQDVTQTLDSVLGKILEKLPLQTGEKADDMTRMSQFMDNFANVAEKMGWASPGSRNVEYDKFMADMKLKQDDVQNKKEIELKKLDLEAGKTDALLGLGQRIAKTAGLAFATEDVEEVQAQRATKGPVKAITKTCPNCNTLHIIPRPEIPREIHCKGCNNVLKYTPDDD